MNVNSPVKLKEDSIEGFQDVFNSFFEYFIFFRWIYFKNNPRGNLLLIRAILAVGLLGFLYYSFFSSFRLIIAGIDVDPVIAMAIFITIGYWNMSSVFHKKSNYCASLYNEYLKQVGSGNKNSALLLGNLLAINLLALDLWAHRTFSSLFAEYLELAIKNTVISDQDINQIFEKINQGKMDVAESRKYLLAHQKIIMDAC